MGTWTNQATRITANRRESTATRSMVCFEVLDYDSLTHVLVNGIYVDVVALIYKKVTITHNQYRAYSLDYSTSEANIKDIQFTTMLPTYLDPAPATDGFAYSGSRTVEYILCLLAGAIKHTVSLGTVTITTAGDYNLSGTDKNLKEDAGVLDGAGPIITVTGNRLYGVNINCGNGAVTYTYDIEEPVGSLSENVLFQADAPINAEDYNAYWSKTNRVVGAMSYIGVNASKSFPYNESSILPDKVLAVNYQIK